MADRLIRTELPSWRRHFKNTFVSFDTLAIELIDMSAKKLTSNTLNILTSLFELSECYRSKETKWKKNGDQHPSYY
jgi:hypothetical protein